MPFAFTNLSSGPTVWNFDAWYEKGLLLEKKGDTANSILALKSAYTLAPVNTYGLELAHFYEESETPYRFPFVTPFSEKIQPMSCWTPSLSRGSIFPISVNIRTYRAVQLLYRP